MQYSLSPVYIDEAYLNRHFSSIAASYKKRYDASMSHNTKAENDRISACKIAKEMWDKLKLTYEGTDKVKETRIDILVTQYEKFQMELGLTMSRSSSHCGESSGASRRPESIVRRMDNLMSSFTHRTIRREDLPVLDRGVKTCARGPLEEPSPSEDVVDLCSANQFDRVYCYLRGDDYPKHFPLDEHLFPFI
ncbi:hypothetical protein Taro_040684 [Colocasia esculenta]|uniref:Uncharacterized protein n=1 Tax=Colocasia esculenta TaxID=4460 RepID=A0A843WJM7_COLES|nr:hypothetical protein [Colocasia esculenta]